jgi:hypothetical protein
MAFGIAAYLGDDGSYVGFDPLDQQIESCQKSIRRGNFRFEHYDLWHRLYRSEGKIDPNSFRFPVDDATIDVVVSGNQALRQREVLEPAREHSPPVASQRRDRSWRNVGLAGCDAIHSLVSWCGSDRDRSAW